MQGLKELEGLEEKAKASGACQLVVKDLKEEFVKDFIFPCLRAGAIYERKYLLGTSMARPVIAKVKYIIRMITMMGLHTCKCSYLMYICYSYPWFLFVEKAKAKLF